MILAIKVGCDQKEKAKVLISPTYRSMSWGQCIATFFLMSWLCGGVLASTKIERGERVLQWREEVQILSPASSAATAQGLRSPTPSIRLQFDSEITSNFVLICFGFRETRSRKWQREAANNCLPASLY